MLDATSEGKADGVKAVAAAGFEIITAQTRGEIDTAVATARRYPRNIAEFRDRAISMATLDEETAASCLYALPRAGKRIEGPSVRFAEIVATAYQHVRCGGRVIAVEEQYVTAQGVAHDLENNVTVSLEVKRRITGKDGRRFNADMIGVASNAATSIALRNAILRVIPLALSKPIYEAARRCAIGDERTLGERRSKAVAYAQELGISPPRFCHAAGRQSVDQITLEDLALLRGLFTAVREGDTTLDEAFPHPKGKGRVAFGDMPKEKDEDQDKMAADGAAEPSAGAPAPNDVAGMEDAERAGYDSDGAAEKPLQKSRKRSAKPAEQVALSTARQDCLEAFAKVPPEDRAGLGFTRSQVQQVTSLATLEGWTADLTAAAKGL